MSVKSNHMKMKSNKLWIIVAISIITIFLLVIFNSKVFKGKHINSNTSLEEFTGYLDKRIITSMEDYKIPGVNIAIVQGGRTIWSKAYGYADLKEERKMTTDTYCRVESISKSITAWGIMKLAEEGRIDLDKPVVEYIKKWDFPPTAFSKERVTIRQLLTHTGGMPLGDIFERYSPKEKIPTLKESLSKEAVIIKEPGSSFMYSNIGYNLLELLIEEVTGRDYSEYMEEEILIPLGMNNSTFNWSNNLKPEVPMGYDLKGNEVPVYIYPAKASGGLFASVEDIAKFISAGMVDYTDNKVLKPESIEEIYTPRVNKIGIYGLVFDSYGYGHYIENLSKEIQGVSHGGQGGGIMTHFHSIPKIGDGIVILTNSQRSWPFIASILRDWAKWCGFNSIGMGKINLAQKILWTLIIIIFLAVIWQLWILAQVFIHGTGKTLLIPKKYKKLQMVQILLSLLLISGLLWCTRQDYLFISSVFPVASRWLGFSILVFAFLLLIIGLFPCICSRDKMSK